MAEADIEAAAAIQVDAFGGVLAEVVGRYHDGPRYSWRDAWVVERGGEISAAAIVIPATWWFRGQSFPISAVAGVAVRPVDRRRRLAHDLMHAILRRDVDLGRPFSLLYPFQHGFYRRLGYGSVGLMHFWRLPLARMPDEPELRTRVRLVREGDRPAIEAVFARSLREHPAGGLERRAGQWQHRWTQEGNWLLYVDAAQGVTGYLVYRVTSGVLDVRELVALTSEAERGLWSFVAAQVEQRAAATYHSPVGKPLWATLSEPYMFEGPEHGFIVNDVAGLTMSFMGRGIDWSAALQPRTFEGVRGQVSVELSDSVFGPRSLRLEFADGRATLSDTSGSDGVRCDVSVFSQIYCGALSAAHARWYGLLAGDDASVALLDQAFPPGPPFITPFDWF
jgi:predicted acetyltransferase